MRNEPATPEQASSTSCKERSLTIEMASLRTMGREWAGPQADLDPAGWLRRAVVGRADRVAPPAS
jgi:hypothetical protein